MILSIYFIQGRHCLPCLPRWHVPDVYLLNYTCTLIVMQKKHTQRNIFTQTLHASVRKYRYTHLLERERDSLFIIFLLNREIFMEFEFWA
uniref:Uncharacterized protein n=1 Tax=Octopus bimaculoides TaxID=37653 RepID=A0A0L8GT31_OCTBM